MISAKSEKGFQDRRLPITPDFAAQLRAVPAAFRNGRVFAIRRRCFGVDRVSRVIAAIGFTAKVEVNKEQNKYASAHDLRRAFGTRWPVRVTPTVLQRLMRHASVETTLKYYVEQSADLVAATLWEHTDRINIDPDGMATRIGDFRS